MGSPYVRNLLDGLIISLLLGLLQRIGPKYVWALFLVYTPFALTSPALEIDIMRPFISFYSPVFCRCLVRYITRAFLLINIPSLLLNVGLSYGDLLQLFMPFVPNLIFFRLQRKKRTSPCRMWSHDLENSQVRMEILRKGNENDLIMK
jgi:hypothetical protein